MDAQLSAAGAFADTVSTGPLVVAVAVAALVGLIGFLSPCVLPLVPGYLAYVAGISGAGLVEAELPAGVAGAGVGVASGAGPAAGSAARSAGAAVATQVRTPTPSQVRRRTVAGAALFVLGFSVVFVGSGIVFGSLGSWRQVHARGLEQIFGTITVVFGLVFLGGIPFLQREVKIHARPRAGLLGAPLLGLTFGLAWTPCLTPTLSAVTSLALTPGASATRGAVLTGAYCVGLGIPFLLVALGFGWATSALGFVRRHGGVVSRIGGIALIIMGVLLVTGLWDHWMNVLASYGNIGLGADL